MCDGKDVKRVIKKASEDAFLYKAYENISVHKEKSTVKSAPAQLP